MSEFNVVSASRIDRERRLQNAIVAFEFEDPQDGTSFDCAFLDAMNALKKEFGPLSNRLALRQTQDIESCANGTAYCCIGSNHVKEDCR